MTSTTPLRLSLELDPGADPLSGRLVPEHGAPHQFVGWIGLANALERVLASPSDVPKEESR